MAREAGDRRGTERERQSEPSSEADRTEFSSSQRAAEAWADTPETWRKVQAEQLDDALTALREHDESEKKDQQSDESSRARRGLIRRFSH